MEKGAGREAPVYKSEFETSVKGASRPKRERSYKKRQFERYPSQGGVGEWGRTSSCGRGVKRQTYFVKGLGKELEWGNREGSQKKQLTELNSYI